MLVLADSFVMLLMVGFMTSLDRVVVPLTIWRNFMLSLKIFNWLGSKPLHCYFGIIFQIHYCSYSWMGHHLSSLCSCPDSDSRFQDFKIWNWYLTFTHALREDNECVDCLVKYETHIDINLKLWETPYTQIVHVLIASVKGVLRLCPD